MAIIYAVTMDTDTDNLVLSDVIVAHSTDRDFINEYYTVLCSSIVQTIEFSIEFVTFDETNTPSVITSDNELKVAETPSGENIFYTDQLIRLIDDTHREDLLYYWTSLAYDMTVSLAPFVDKSILRKFIMSHAIMILCEAIYENGPTSTKFNIQKLSSKLALDIDILEMAREQGALVAIDKYSAYREQLYDLPYHAPEIILDQCYD